MMGFGWGWRPYVSVAQRRENARHKMSMLKKQGIEVLPVEVEGRKIARTFWGESWCKHLESFSDYENRLLRGRTYVRNGSVCHLQIASGEVKSIVSGSELYDVQIAIEKLPQKIWSAVKERCSGQIGSLLELLKGRLSSGVMAVVTDRNEGLFPRPAEISLKCSCPDWAVMCKHLAAVLYGVGARLDEKPELLFLLRGVDHEELIEAKATATTLAGGKRDGLQYIAEGDLEDVFGIELFEKESSDSRRQRSKQRKDISASGEARTALQGEGNGTGTTRQPSKAKERAGLPPTGKTVQELRGRLDLTRSRLALLIGVSAASVSKWEKTRGQLNLQPRTLNALGSATQLTKKQALKLLESLNK